MCWMRFVKELMWRSSSASLFQEQTFWREAFCSGNVKKKISPTAMLKVSFFGEAGIDTGALRKEFLTGELKEINYFSVRIIYVEEMTNP